MNKHIIQEQISIAWKWRKVTFLFSVGAHFGDFHAEIFPFSVHRIRNLYLNSPKFILYSWNQTYITIHVISGHTVVGIERKSDIFVYPGGYFGDFHAEILPFSVHRIRNLCLNSLKFILYSSNQTYMTIQVISGHTVVSIGRKIYIFVSPGGYFGDFHAEILPFSVHRIRNLCLNSL